MNKSQSLSSFFQAMPPFRGKRRLCKIILNVSGLSKSRNITVDTKSGKFELPNLIEIVSFDLFVNGYYERGLVRLLNNRIPRNGIFIDVGANIGSISIPLARMRPDIKVIAIEASPWIYNVLNRNISLNNIRNITAVNYAVYYESGKELPMYAPKDLFGKGSLNPLFTKESEMVTSITIDDIKDKFSLPDIDFIKVDVEGFEVCVFRGMNYIIGSNKPKIIFEFSEWSEKTAGFKPGEAQSVLLSKGYKLQQFDHEFNLIGEPKNSINDGKGANLFAF